MDLESLKRVLATTAALYERVGGSGSVSPVMMLNALPKDSPDRAALEIAIHNYTIRIPWLAGRALSIPTMGLIIEDAAEILAAEHAEV